MPQIGDVATWVEAAGTLGTFAAGGYVILHDRFNRHRRVIERVGISLVVGLVRDKVLTFRISNPNYYPIYDVTWYVISRVTVAKKTHTLGFRFKSILFLPQARFEYDVFEQCTGISASKTVTVFTYLIDSDKRVWIRNSRQGFKRVPRLMRWAADRKLRKVELLWSGQDLKADITDSVSGRGRFTSLEQTTVNPTVEVD